MKIKQIVLPILCLSLTFCQRVQDAPFLSAGGQSIKPYPQTVEYYKDKENSAEPALVDTYALKVAGRLLEEGRINAADNQLDRITPESIAVADEKYLLMAKSALIKGRVQSALRYLAKVKDRRGMGLALQLDFHQVLLKAYEEKGDWANMLGEYVILTNLVQNSKHESGIQQKLWQALRKVPLKNQMALSLDAEPELKGWLDLSIISKQNRDDGVGMLKAINEWKEMNPNHPGNGFIASNNSWDEAIMGERPKSLALMLPLTGPLSGPGLAIRDGFMSSYYQAKGYHPKIRFYDTYQHDVTELYHQAVLDGADFVIGPLEKQNVEKISSLSLSVPVLSLNEINQRTSSSLFQFSLSQQDEALQVAEKAFEDGKRRALVIGLDNAWGQSITAQFVAHWQALGGTVVDNFTYGNKTNMSQAVRKLLHIDESQMRDIKLGRLLNKKLKFIPRRRQDFDMIFLLAYPSKARQIRPLLKYFYAGNVPIYATSLVYAGNPNPRQDSDLNGIIFSDMPWLLNHRHKLVKKSWPEQFNSYNRLYAMGRDSFLLTNQLKQLSMFPLMGMKDHSGTLFMDKSRKVRRRVDWAKFKRGLAVKIG